MEIRKLLFHVCFVAVLAGGAVACSDDNDDEPLPTVSTKDQNIMMQASFGNIAEIGAGKLADSLSGTTEVKEFGQMMIADHSVAQQDLQQLANAWSVDIPQAPDSMHKAKMQQLMMMTGHMFDTAYINAQIMDHQATISLLEMAADESDQQAIREYANKYLPKVRMHLEHAQMIASQLAD